MNHKYGTYPDSQFKDYKKRMHNLVHWLLIYYEEGNPILGNYFGTVQYKLNGMNELLFHPARLVELMGQIESAKLEYETPDCDGVLFRKMILDAHALIDKI